MSGVYPGPVCGRQMDGGRCGMPHLHRSRCVVEQPPKTCALCKRSYPCDVHEGCYALGFHEHQDIAQITTKDYLGTETTTKCRRCGARFSSVFIPLWDAS